MKFDKWLACIELDEAVRNAAAISLKHRIRAVSHFLPLAAKRHRESTEYVHQLRVWCRRSGAAIHLYKRSLNGKETKWFLKTLNRIRKSAGQARDLDVLLARYEDRLNRPSCQSLLSVLLRARNRSQKPIEAIHRSVAKSHGLDRRAGRLIGKKKHVKDIACFQIWAEQQFDRAIADFYSRFPKPQPTIGQLHRFRIGGKNLRYTIEMLAAAFPQCVRTELYPLISTLQIELGDMNDHSVAVQQLQRLANSHNSKQLRKLIKIEERAMDASISSFCKRWSQKRKRQFSKTLDHIRGDPDAG
ncbi:MAG: CHAD domain-containing protein [Planctomycetota bacterium]